VGAAERMRKLLRTPKDPIEIHVENALVWVQRHTHIELSEEQQQAIRAGIESKVLLLTGGPGTGKTTVLKSLLAILEKKGLSFVLGAPTGRAAKRMSEATGRDTATLHRMLEFSPKTGGFTRNEADPLLTDLLVVDEASMLDIELFHAVLRALPDFARLILVGDVDQLPSVGPGNVLFDCIASEAIPIVPLTQVFRQAAESGIVSNAHRINRGQVPEFNETDFFLIPRDDAAAASDTIVELVARRMPPKFELDPKTDIQVLSPMRRGDAGTVKLNEALQDALNPHGELLPKRAFRVGDKVMQQRNNYDLDVYNGDVGFIAAVDGDDCRVDFDGRPVTYAPRDVDQLSLAYAATIHKSQGSEYPAVVMPFLSQHYMMLQRNVLYTGITRGKRLVIIVGNEKAIRMAVRSTQSTRRSTKLAERLRGAA